MSVLRTWSGQKTNIRFFYSTQLKGPEVSEQESR